MIIVLQTLVFFRESLIAALDRIFRPYLKHFALTFNRNNNVSDDEDSEDHVYAEFDDEKGVVFYPPVYAQRYAAVSDCLMDERWCGLLEKVVDFGYHDMSFIKYLKDVPGIKHILGVDIESIPLRCSSDLLGSNECMPKRESPLHVSLFQGNAADPDYRLIGCDAVIAIEMIEHMYPQDLERLVHTIFGFIKPWIAVISTPNGDFNPLFKSMEKNGFRRLDHFFEWSREQFHDWCSNIVLRYPHYTVSCRGVGPGPPGTIQYGCCSQLALFVSKDYHKQQDLNLNSLALVAKGPSNNICNVQAVDIPDNENYDMYSTNKLNCTTLQVKKFSKKTQYLMAKNSIDSLVHTKEVVDDIRHLTKMLNFNTESREQTDGDFIWRNINWGDNAPYWNQYYQIVREYTYPVEAKSEESRLLDLISDEINRFVDLQCDEDFATDMNKVEIPLDHLMRVVHHITDDVDKVKDLLEWNGYEVSDGVVIYSRLVLDTMSVNSHDDGWRDSDISDWDTDVHSTSLSNGSTIGADFHGRNLYRALDQKVRKLRSMMSNNEDISVELDRVVCRLMKLALRTARQRERPLSYRWMQCKLFDLLNLTEKALEKKRQMFVEFDQHKAICYDDNQIIPEVDIAKIKTDETANEIVNKYRYLVLSPDKSNRSEEGRSGYDAMEDEFVNDFLKDSASMELSFEDIMRSPALVDIEPINSVYPRIQYFNPKETLLSRTKAWIDEDVNLVVYSQNSDQGISSGDTDHSACNIARYKHQKNSKKQKKSAEGKDLDVKRRKRTQSKTSHGKRNKKRKKYDNPQSKEKTSKTILKKRSSYNIIIKTSSKKLSSVNIGQFGHYFLKAKKSLKRHTHDTGSRPISKTLIELCNPENEKKDYNMSVQENTSNSMASPNIDCSIAATKESLHIGIVTENNEEILAFRRTIGTDPEDETTFIEFEPDDIHGSMTNIMNLDSFYNKADREFENIHSQTLFLYDINEPSTSKGVRRVSLDAQCGPETNHKYAMLSTNTSLSKMPEMFNTGLKIEKSCSDVRRNITNCDFGTCTNDNLESFKTISPKERYTGITIKDSVTKITEKNESGTMTQAYEQVNEMPPVPKNSAISSPETTMLKPISSYLKVDDSGSEFCDSICSSQRSALHFMKYAKDAREIQTKLTVSEDVGEEHKFTRKYTRPKLTNGGVYVHSYKERQVSEDVVFHGEWQKHIPLPTQIKNCCNVVSKKTPEANKIIKANFKENVTENIIVKPKTRVKDLPPKNTYLKDVKKGQYTDQVKKLSTSNVADIKNCYRNTKKLTSKFTVRPVVVKKSHHILKKPSKTSTAVKKDSEIAPKLRKKSYIPVYLKRKLSKNKLQILQTENALKEPESGNNKTDLNVTEEINKSLMNVEFPPRENLSIVVFQNEIVNNKSNVNYSTDSERLIDTEHFIDNIADDCNMRSLSPQSLNSSADSSSTVATVRVRPIELLDRRHSNSSNKSNSGISQMENTPVQTKKVTRCKSARRYQDKVSDNKENLPETSKKNNRNNSNTFTKNKNVFRAQIAKEAPSKSNNTINKRKSINKPDIKIPSIPSSIGKQSISGTSCKPSVSKRRSTKSPDNKSINDFITSDPVATPTTMSQASDNRKTNVIINIVDNNQLTKWLDSTQVNVVENKTSVLNAIRELVEERLDFIEKMPVNNAEIDFRTSPMTEKCDSIPVSDTASFYDASSLNSSYGTVMGFNDLDSAQIMDFDSTVMEFNDQDHAQTMDFDRTVIGFNDLDHAQVMDFDNNFFDSVVYNKFDPVLGNDSTIGISGTKPNVSDLEALSFKSISAASKMSEYYLAESSINNVCASSCDPPNLDVPTHNSVRDIFERKPHPSLQSPAGPLGAQAFSGLSMNAASITGDQPDPVNLVDSETGSGARQFARQATSEEVFVSGRSSESYESCLIDDDTVVPNWLFQIISRQRSVQEEDEDEEEDEEEESDDLASNLMPLEQPVYDVNGNTVEPGMGASAGAGDGRGIHSDHSQDSSGRGTSLSSTASSSPHSEAIIIDPTAFTTQLDLTREPDSSSVLAPLLPVRMEAADTSHAIVAGQRRNPVLNSSGDPQIDPIQATSDVDADISSTDTDVPDYSDN